MPSLQCTVASISLQNVIHRLVDVNYYWGTTPPTNQQFFPSIILLFSFLQSRLLCPLESLCIEMLLFFLSDCVTRDLCEKKHQAGFVNGRHPQHNTHSDIKMDYVCIV